MIHLFLMAGIFEGGSTITDECYFEKWDTICCSRIDLDLSHMLKNAQILTRSKVPFSVKIAK